ncbi:MAG: hypothetical protein ACI353_06620, partial [Alloprevotella sp.]
YFARFVFKMLLVSFSRLYRPRNFSSRRDTSTGVSRKNAKVGCERVFQRLKKNKNATNVHLSATLARFYTACAPIKSG